MLFSPDLTEEYTHKSCSFGNPGVCSSACCSSSDPCPPEAERAIHRMRLERAEQTKANYYNILRGHSQMLTALLEKATFERAAEADAAALAAGREESMAKLTENFIQRHEVLS